MFESALLEHKLDKATYKTMLPELRAGLLEAQQELLEQRALAVVVLVTGMDTAGKGEVIQRLYEWLDPRHLRASAYGAPDDGERARPRLWRYWRDLPPKGEIGIVFGSWYNEPLLAFLNGAVDAAAAERELEALNRFEAMLANEGVLLLKFMLVVSAGTQRKRLRAIQKGKGARRHVLEEWSSIRRRKAAFPLIETVVRRTSPAHAPWVVLPSDDPEYRDLTFGQTLLETLRHRLAGPQRMPEGPAAVLVPTLDRRTPLDALDLGKRLDDGRYDRELVRWQDRLALLTDRPEFGRLGVVAVFEGNDAAGKGGSIRRVAAAIDPRRLRMHSIAAPTDEEKAQPYLWRFWRRLPRHGRVAIFDRSWYGRVLVERIEGFAREGEWLRAYGEINDFEEQLTASGFLVVKFWLAISKDEQLRRFEERAGTAYKQFKITAEDWRNREKWDAYAEAVGDMVDRTSTPQAPWVLVAAEDKRWARVRVLKTLCRRIEAALSR